MIRTLFCDFVKIQKKIEKKKKLYNIFDYLCKWERPPTTFKVNRSANGGGLGCTAKTLNYIKILKQIKKALTEW